LIKHEGVDAGFLRLAYYAFHFKDSMNRIIVYMLIANFVGILILFFAAIPISPWPSTYESCLCCISSCVDIFSRRFSLELKRKISTLFVGIISFMSCSIEEIILFDFAWFAFPS